MADYIVKINLKDCYYELLRRSIYGELESLRVILRSLEDRTHQKLARPAKGRIVEFQSPDTGAFPEKRDNEIRKTFVRIIDNFIDFLDRNIAIKEFASKPIRVSKRLSGNDEIKGFLIGEIDKVVGKISADTSLKNPSKVGYFSQISNFSQNAALGYLSLRNDIVHHKNVAKEDAKMIYREMQLSVKESDGKEEPISELPKTVHAGDKIGVGFRDYERVVYKGEEIKISEGEIEGIIFTIELVITPEIIR